MKDREAQSSDQPYRRAAAVGSLFILMSGSEIRWRENTVREKSRYHGPRSTEIGVKTSTFGGIFSKILPDVCTRRFCRKSLPGGAPKILEK